MTRRTPHTRSRIGELCSSVASNERVPAAKSFLSPSSREVIAITYCNALPSSTETDFNFFLNEPGQFPDILFSLANSHDPDFFLCDICDIGRKQILLVPCITFLI
jgi:hypothetical protein